MLKQTSLSMAVHRVLYGAAIATAVGAPTLSHAQSQQAPGPLEEVVVTGSRLLQDPNIASVSPITTVGSAEITARGITRIEDLVNSLPQVTPEFTSTLSNGATGTATLDLRGLGSGRTLVLTNGHRMGYGDPYELAPDVNQVPTALIQRVEVLTGGASSTYGSDAVAGVVNFIMKDDFQGFQFNYEYAGYRHSQGDSAVQQQLAASGFTQAPSKVTDGDTTNISVVIGANTPDGKGNVEGYLGYRNIAAITQATRDFSACALSDTNGVSCGGSITLPTGMFTPFDGTNYYTVQGNNFIDASTAGPNGGFLYYNYAPLNYFQRPDKRYTGGLFGHYQVSPQFVGYAEFQFMDDHTLAQIAPSGDFFVTSQIHCDNPLLSAQERQTITNAGYPCGPGDTVPWYIGRRNVEGGPRYDDLRHTSYRTLGGVRGDISDRWHYDISANLSRLVFSEVYQNDLSITRINRALDVVIDPNTGLPACRTAVSGVDPNCVPWNVFQTGGVTQAAINYLKLPLFSDAHMSQDQYVAYATGDLGTIPSATEAIEVAFGVEHINSAMNFNPDLGYQTGDGAGQGSTVPPVDGTLDVSDYFGEVKLPIIADKRGVQQLNANLRYHHSSYSTGVKANTYNVGVEYAPISGVMLRGSRSRSVRAANILELFQPQNVQLWGGVDPCAGATPDLTQAQCANAGVSAAQYGSVPANPAGQYNELAGGNLTLDPEKSDSTTFGVVLSNLVDGLTLSVDYWRIKVKDAIDTVDPEYAIRQCGITGDAALCSLIHRAPNGNIWVPTQAGGGYVTATNVNIGFFDTSGIDLVGSYTFNVGSKGSLNLNLRASHLAKFDKQPVPGAAIDHCAGVWGGACNRPRPDWRHTLTATWTTPWKLGVSFDWRRISSMPEFSLNRFTAPTTNFFDLSGTYSPMWLGGQVDLSVGINNLTDKDPPVSGFFNTVDTYANGNTFPGTWDTLGRYYFVSFNYHL